jgi:hypothetical protein
LILLNQIFDDRYSVLNPMRKKNPETKRPRLVTDTTREH